ncbi:hypothetical protein BaRGS_00024599 [Batillaria attramentaria]|uniref:Uncharacterized protein n=1 Tax=Batillaria attramentaria TaxID=370345 RepID=A0ABD0KAK2_9CAEN
MPGLSDKLHGLCNDVIVVDENKLCEFCDRNVNVVERKSRSVNWNAYAGTDVCSSSPRSSRISLCGCLAVSARPLSSSQSNGKTNCGPQAALFTKKWAMTGSAQRRHFTPLC